jgi:segregation and condensation protein B
MEELKKKVEAILFSVGKKIDIEKLKSLCDISDEAQLISCLNQLKQDYNQKNSPMMVMSEGDQWKLTVRENYLPLVRNIVTDTELSKSVTETLAVIAFKYPITQAELVKIRSNKAYDHVKELQKIQFIEKIKSGRTFKIKLTQKFFEYFDLPEQKLKKKFSNFEEVEKVISKKEKQYIEERKEIEERNKELQEELKSKQKSESDYMEELDQMQEKFQNQTENPSEDRQTE